MITGIWSQIIPSVISISLYRLEIDFRGAPILGFVGAGGIGLAIRGYSGSLRYPELLGVTLLIVVLVLLMEMLSAFTRRAILGSELGSKSIGGVSQPTPGVLGDHGYRPMVASNAGGRPQAVASPASGLSAPWTRDRIKLNVAGWGSIGLLVGAFTIPDISIREFFSSIGEMPSIFWRLVPKDMTWLTSTVVADLIETVAIGFAATFLALIVAVPLSFFAAANTAPSRAVYRFTRLLALLVRAAPDLVIAVILVAALGLGPAAGTIALAFGMVGFATKLLADNVEEVAEAPRDGVFATGATRLQEVGTGVTPQVLPSMLGNMLYLFDISLRSSTVLGIVGAGGIGFLLNNAAKTLNFEVMGGIILSIFVIVYSIELLSSWVRRQVI
jgi:phosphonate transport system permease protein